MTDHDELKPTGRLSQLSRAGVSIWLDDLSRERLQPLLLEQFHHLVEVDADLRQVVQHLLCGSRGAADLVPVHLAVVGEGLQKFDASWAELVETVQGALVEARQGKPRAGSGAG